jgi:ClpP class serine protease
MSEQKPQISNSDVDFFIANGEFEIDHAFAMQEFTWYLQELAEIRAGLPYEALGIAERRRRSMPGIITAASKRVSDPKMLKDESLTPKGSFAHLRLQGVMRSKDGASSRGVNSLIEDMNAAFDNDRIQGILIEANTGGGEVTAGLMLQSIIEQSPKAIVVYAHQLASAGVRATLPADEIIASSKSAEIGSIGTFISLPRNFAARYKEYFQDIYADKSTNKNAWFRQWLEGDLSGLKADINRSNDNFLADVQKYRELKGSEKQIEEVLSGKMFYAPEAKRRGLVDGIGGFQYAVKRLKANVNRRKKS